MCNTQAWFDLELVKYVIWQVEKAPTTGTRHLQGYFVIHEQHGDSGRASMKWVNDHIYKQMYVAKRMGTHQQAIDYCRKQESRVAGPYEYGQHIDADANRKGIGNKKKATLDELRIKIDNGVPMEQLWIDHFNIMTAHSKAMKEYSKIVLSRERRPEPKTFVFWGPPGTGKTHRVVSSIERLKLNAFWYRPGVGGAWFDGYDPLVHDCVVFDEFKGQVPYTLMLALLDKYPCHVEGKGTSISFRPKVIFITSNFAPNEWYGRNGKKEFHSSHEDAGSTVMVEKAFDSSALMRRLAPPMGEMYEMTEKYAVRDQRSEDFELIMKVIEAPTDEEAAEVLAGFIDLTDESDNESPPNSIDDNPYLNYQDGDGHGEYDDDETNDWEQEQDVQDALEESRAPFIVATPPTSPRPLNKATLLKRTDELTFRKPEQARQLFKKLGPEPVQSTLAWAPKRKRQHDDDDDIDDKLDENSQKK